MNLFTPSSLGTAGWLLVGIVPPAIFALYFLKLKRQPLEVPSTYLWHRVIEDLHVNSLWQRLRQSLLLFLQLLIAVLAILALLRPGWQGQALRGQRFIFLIDNSASMSAEDAPDGKTRLEEAKKRVAGLVEQMRSDMSAMIITFAEQPDVVQEFTNNRRLLREALDRIEPTAGKTDLTGALQLADGFANPGKVYDPESDTDTEVTQQQPVELYIFSDGRFRNVSDFSLGNLNPLFLPIGTFEAANLAITAFNTRRVEDRPDQQQAFVQVANFSNEDRTVVVELYLDDNLVDAANLKLSAGGVGSTNFTLAQEAAGELRAQLDIPAGFEDMLAADNKAYCALENRSDGRVLLVTPRNNHLERALSTERADRFAKVEKIAPQVLETKEFQTQAQTENYDLIIFDQCAPKAMPQANTLFVGQLPPAESWIERSSKEKEFGPQITDWDRSHPLLNLIELGNVLIYDSYVVKPPAGGRILVDSTRGPLLAIAPRDRYEDAVLGFEIVGRDEEGNYAFNTTWPRKRSFPLFWLNVLEYFSKPEQSSQTFTPDELAELRVNSLAEKLQVELPNGETRGLSAEQPGRLVFPETEQLGIYRVKDNRETIKLFAVNLFDRDESDVALEIRQEGEDVVKEVKSLEIGYVDVSAQSPTAPVRRELWKPLLLIALVVLVLEWYIYNRRVYV